MYTVCTCTLCLSCVHLRRNEILSAKNPQVQKVEIKDGGSQKAAHPQPPGDSYNNQQALQCTTSNTGLPTNNASSKTATPNPAVKTKGTGSQSMSRDVSLRASTHLGTGGKEGRTSTALQRRKVIEYILYMYRVVHV